MMQRDNKLIAFVCTGNTCRSPMAEGIFNKLAGEKNLSVKAESFGAATVTGLPVSQNSLLTCKEIGVDLSGKTSVAIEDAEIEKYQKFYCMSQSHARLLSQLYFVPQNEIEVMNVSDPYGGNLDVYRQCRNEIYSYIEGIVKEYEN